MNHAADSRKDRRRVSKPHQKKRNAGLLREFLVCAISGALVDGDAKRANAALRIVRRFFKPGTELHKEFRLVNSLVRTTVSSEAIAASILQEAKAAARALDPVALDREKSLLIGAINRALGGDSFYDQHVNEYRTYATVQTLINDWRSKNADIGRVAQYEDQLLHWLTSSKQGAPDEAAPSDRPGESRLLMKVMMKKLNEKYSGMLTSEQKELLRAYAFSSASDDPESIKLKLREMRDRLVGEISSHIDSHPTDEYTNKKLVEVKEQLAQEQVDSVDDDAVTRFMLYAKLCSELASKGDDNG